MNAAMNKKVKYLLYLTGLILLLLLFFQIRAYYIFIKSPVAGLAEAFPTQTQIVIEASNAADFINTTRASGLSEVLSSPESSSDFSRVASLADSLSAEDEIFRNILEQKPFMKGFMTDSSGKQSWLLAFSIGKQNPSRFTAHVKGWAERRGYSFSKNNHPLTDFFKVCRNNHCVSYYIHKGLLCLSADSSTLLSSLNALENNSNLNNDPLFLSLKKTSGKKVDATLILRTAQMMKLLNVSENALELAEFFENAWTTLDLTLRKDKLLLNGFTATSQPIKLFAGQNAMPIQLSGIPDDMISIHGILLNSPYLSIHGPEGSDTIHTLAYDKGSETFVREIFSPAQHLYSWLGNYSFCFLDKNNRKVVVMENRQTDSTANTFGLFMEPAEAGIAKISDESLYNKVFGNMYPIHGAVYCLNRPPVTAFSSSPAALMDYNSFLQAPGIRHPDNSIVQMLNEAGEKASFFAIYNPQNKHISPEGTASPLKKCELLTFKISTGEPYMYSSGILYFEAPAKELALNDEIEAADSIAASPVEPATEAAIGTETSIIFTPLIIQGKKAGENQVAFLSNNSLKVTDFGGHTVFEWQAPEMLTGQLFTTGFTQSSQPRYIITGQHYLYHLSADGSLLNKTKLPAEMSSASGFFDYERRKDYRLIYQGPEKKIYSITLAGKVLPDWQQPKTGELAMAPKFIRYTGKDYLIFSTVQGDLIITDRRGRVRISVYSGFKKSSRAGVFENRTNAKGIFLTASVDGRLSYVTDNGVVSYSSFGQFGENPYFEYADFDGDGSMDFMFSGDEKLGVYTRMKKSIVELKINGGQLGKPFLYASLGKGWVAVRDKKTSKVYLMNSKGAHIGLNNLKSDTDPVIFNPGGSRQIVMVTSRNNKAVFTTLK